MENSNSKPEFSVNSSENSSLNLSENSGSNSRRNFFKNSAKLGVASAAFAGLGGILNLANAATNSSSNSSVNSSKNSQLNSTQNSSENSQKKGQNMQTQIWYITGGSGGLGLALAKYALSKGDKVAVTSRKIANLEAKFGKESENFLPLKLTFEKNLQKQIVQNVAAIKRKFGRLDNVVNNAGYGLGGFVEEVSEAQLREQFEVNVFAAFLVAQESLKVLRPQALSEGGSAQNVRGRIFNLSSIAGFRVPNASTPYSMSKFALSALSEGLMLDLADFGIAVVNVMPAGFRTEFLGASWKAGGTKIADYDAKRAAATANVSAYNGKQAGDPAKFAEVIYAISRQKTPPFSLFMGDGAYKSAENKIAFVQKDMKATRSYAGAAVDFADAGGSVFDRR